MITYGTLVLATGALSLFACMWILAITTGVSYAALLAQTATIIALNNTQRMQTMYTKAQMKRDCKKVSQER